MKPRPRGFRNSPLFQNQLGQQLRAMYDGLQSEPLPDHLLDLLKQLEKPRAKAEK
jgi:hypothetical protein